MHLANILPLMCLWTRKNWFDFGSHLLPDPDPGIFWTILQHSKVDHFFPQFGCYLQKNWTDLHENFITDVSLDKGVPVKFWKSSGSGVLIRTPDMDSRSGPYHCLGTARVRTPDFSCDCPYAHVCLSVCLLLKNWKTPVQKLTYRISSIKSSG